MCIPILGFKVQHDAFTGSDINTDISFHSIYKPTGRQTLTVFLLPEGLFKQILNNIQVSIFKIGVTLKVQPHTKILSSLGSLWTTPSLCMKARASVISFAHRHTSLQTARFLVFGGVFFWVIKYLTLQVSFAFFHYQELSCDALLLDKGCAIKLYNAGMLQFSDEQN